MRPLFSEKTLPPERVRRFNYAAHIGNIRFLPTNRPSATGGQGPLFSITEFTSVDEAKRAYGEAYVDYAGATVNSIPDCGEWVSYRLKRRDGTRMTYLAASQQVENIIVTGIINMDAYQDPHESLTAQIKQGGGEETYGEDGFHSFALDIAEHYRANVSYTKTPIRPEKYSGLATPFRDFDRGAAQRIAENRLNALAESIERHNLRTVHEPVDVVRAFRVRLGETQQHWFEPALSADWYADQPRDWAGPTNVYVIAVDDPQTLTSLIANRLTRGWGVRQLITGGGTHLSYTSSDSEQVLLGLDSSGMSAENYPTAVVTGKIYKYIVSGNVLLAFPDVSLPRPE